MPEQQSAEFGVLVSREQAENAFADALRLFVGRGRQFSVEQLVKGIGLNRDGKPHTKPIYDFISYRAGHPDHRPLHFGLIVSITAFLGADFTNEWLHLTGQGAFGLPDEEPDPGNLAADNSDDNAAITRAAIDRDFDDTERPGLKVVGARMMTRGAQLVALPARKCA